MTEIRPSVAVRDTRRRELADAVFRVLLSSIFIVAGVGHLMNTSGVVTRLEAAPLADLVLSIAPAEVLVVGAGVVLMLGGLALLLGARTRLTSLLLMGVLVPITLTVQLSPEHIGPLFKNVAIFGGLLHFWVDGARGPSVDAALARRRTALAEVA